MEIENIKILNSSTGWKDLQVEIDRMIEGEVVKLKIAQPEAIVRIQEKIRALEGLKHLPEDIVAREAE